MLSRPTQRLPIKPYNRKYFPCPGDALCYELRERFFTMPRKQEAVHEACGPPGERESARPNPFQRNKSLIRRNVWHIRRGNFRVGVKDDYLCKVDAKRDIRISRVPGPHKSLCMGPLSLSCKIHRGPSPPKSFVRALAHPRPPGLRLRLFPDRCGP
jgi:hypothetical protein